MPIFRRQKKKFGPSDWATNSEAAREEALRRIEFFKLASFGGAISHNRSTGIERELFLSDLCALPQLPNELCDIEGLDILFLGAAEHKGVKYEGLKHLRDISILSNLTELRHLSISGTRVTDLSPLSKLSKLEILDMENIPAFQINEICLLENLREIYLSGSSVFDLSPLAKLPAASREVGVRFGIKNVPALENDPGLKLLARLGSEQSGDEVIQYLNGNHPAFTDISNAGNNQIRDRLARVSPVKFTTENGKIEAYNNNDFDQERITQRIKYIENIDSHVSYLLEEAQFKQVPEDIIRRLERYKIKTQCEDVMFIELDSPMSFIRGALRDDYMRDATDKGFLSGCDKLVHLHDSLRRNFVHEDADLNAFIDKLDAEIDAKLVTESVEMACMVVSDVGISQEIGKSVLDAMNSLKDFSDAARNNIGRVSP